MKSFTLEHREKLRQAKLKNPVRYWLGKKRPELKNTEAVKTMFKKGIIPWSKSMKGVSLNSGKTHFKKGHIPWCKGKKSFYRGEKHWNWKGGITKKNTIERVRFKKYFFNKVLQRDNYTCQLCGLRGVSLQVDHIQSWAEYVELRFSLDNCRTVCMSCHYKITFGKPMPSKVKTWGHNFLWRDKI